MRAPWKEVCDEGDTQGYHIPVGTASDEGVSFGLATQLEDLARAALMTSAACSAVCVASARKPTWKVRTLG